MIRVGLIGLGGITAVHIDAYRKLPNVTLVAAADILLEEAKNYPLLEGMDVRLYRTMEELLEKEDVDMLDVCTPTYLHAEMVKTALLRGIPVLSEKPMARTVAEAEEILAVAKRTKTPYMVAHVVRFMKPYVYLRRIIEGGELGALLHLQMDRLSALPTWGYEHWFQKPEESGGVSLDLAIHDIDFVSSLFHAPKQLHAAHYERKDEKGLLTAEYLTASLLYDGFSVDITGTFYPCNYPFNAGFRAVFEKGYLELKGSTLCQNGAAVDLSSLPAEKTGINIPTDSAYTEEIALFLDTLQSGAPVAVTPESALETLRLVERIRTVSSEIQ